MTPQEMSPGRRRSPRSERSPLWHANAFLARPIAALFAMLGFSAGQLSIQSFTVTAVGLLRMASGEWAHIVQGTLIVYGGLLLDHADHLITLQKGRPPAWSVFLGLVVDRIVEAGLVVGLGVLLVVGLRGVPDGLDHAWAPLSQGWALVLAAATLATMLLWRLAGAYADVLFLRTHLLSTRRLPGPSIIPRRPEGVARLNRLFDRDLLVLVWLLGLVLAQLQLALLLVLAAHVAALVETLGLFWTRRRDPEPQASRILGETYP